MTSVSRRLATLPASPFFLGQAFFSPSVTLGDIDDACIDFGRDADAGASQRRPASASPAQGLPARESPVSEPTVATRRIGEVFTLSGRVAAVEIRPAHVYLVLAVTDESGRVERWAIEGDPEATLAKAGWTLRGGIVRLGETVSARVYSKPNAKPSPGRDSLKLNLEQLAEQGRLGYGLELTLSNGKKLVFGTGSPVPPNLR